MDCNIQSTQDLMKSLIISNPYVVQQYRILFNRCDNNKDGYISMKELKHFIESQEKHPISPEMIKTIHENFDKNGDAKLDFEEFLEMINNPIVTKLLKRIRSRYLKFVVITPPPVPHVLRLETTETRTGLYDEELTCKRYTVGMLTISAIQIIFYYINMMFKDGGQGIIEGVLKFTPSKKYEVWRYVTHIFVHASPAHLFPNVLIQILIGIPLEMVHSWRVIVIYVAGALGGCLAHAVIAPKTELVGGSGGFYSFYTAHIATVIMNWREMTHPLVHLILFGIMTIFDPIYNYVYQRNMGDVSYIAHLGGSVVGLLLGVSILRNMKVTPKENIVWYICMIAYIIIMTILITFNIIL